ncbi:MAG: alpha-E domain-containing protein [Aliiglaciecola sp.]
MLSRVANNLCWMGRYLERAENTARLINVNFNLLLDLPKGIELGWQPIVDIVTDRNLFFQTHSEANELTVVDFMVSDVNHLGSIVNSLSAARENARTIREIIPRESWEQINELYLYAKANSHNASARKTRYEFLTEIIESIQKINGILSGTMTHDEGYQFLKIGRNLERAEMTTRIIDVRSASLLPNVETEQSAFENLQWMSVLKSLTAYQMYRRSMRIRIRRADVLKFLLLEEDFPRSLLHALHEIERCLQRLPECKEAIITIREIEMKLRKANPQELLQDKLHEFIDEMQLGLIDLFSRIESKYF